jgi:hypothetical protein
MASRATEPCYSGFATRKTPRVCVLRIHCLTLALLLAACGGGGDGPADLRALSDCDDVSDEGDNPRIGNFPIAAGTARSCVLQVANIGTGTSRETTYSLALPATMSLQSATCSAEGGARCPAAMGLGGALADLPPGAVLQLTFVLGTPPFRNETLQGSFTAHASNDDISSNDSAAIVVRLLSIDLSIALSAPAQAAPGQDLVVDATISNHGPIDFGGPVPWPLLPGGVELSWIETLLPNGTPVDFGFHIEGQYFAVPVGTSLILRHHLHVVATSGTLDLRIEAPDISDPMPADNTASVIVEVAPAATLR